MQISDIVDYQRYALADNGFLDHSRATLDREGVLVLPGFLTPETINSLLHEGEAQQSLAYYTDGQHNVYLSPADAALPSQHPRNRQVTSSKGCITTDQIPEDSALHILYAAEAFQAFLRSVLGEAALYEYADPLSSINVHYAANGQELGWHFDNSSFAITLMVRAAERGGVFEYVKDVRDADSGDMSYDRVGSILDGNEPVQTLSMEAGTLVLFRGRNSMHRVTPVESDLSRMLVVLAYNTLPGVALSESARMTFYGRLG